LINYFLMQGIDINDFLNHVYEKKMNGEITYSLQPNMDINTSNILKTIGAFYSVIAAIGIYYRDISQPIFGI